MSDPMLGLLLASPAFLLALGVLVRAIWRANRRLMHIADAAQQLLPRNGGEGQGDGSLADRIVHIEESTSELKESTVELTEATVGLKESTCELKETGTETNQLIVDHVEEHRRLHFWRNPFRK